MNLQEAIYKVLDGNALLFVGSGYSSGATNVKGTGFLTGGRLTEEICKMAGIPGETPDLRIASQYYLSKFGKEGENKLIEFLKDEFTLSKSEDYHKEIARLPWHRIYTTNYDTIIENAVNSSGTGARLTAKTMQDNPEECGPREKIVMHLNGCIDTLNSRTLASSFKLTSTSYLTNQFNESKWKPLFINELRACDAAIFIGFSMGGDLDITRLIDAAEIKEKSFFVVWEHESTINKSILEPFGKVYAIGTKGFAKEVKEALKTYIPADKNIISLHSFERILQNWNPVNVTDRMFYDLISYGKVNKDACAISVNNRKENTYFLHRSAVLQIKEKVLEGILNVVVTSQMGNGKSLCLEALAYVFRNSNYDVFILRRSGIDFPKEAQWICENYPNAIIIIDDYHAYRDEVETVASFRKSQVLILSERSYIFDFNSDEIDKKIGSFYTFDIDALSNSDIKEIIERFDLYSLWENDTIKKYSTKESFLKDGCHRHLSEAIISQLPQSHEAEKVTKLVDALRKDSDFFTLLIMILLNSTYSLGMKREDYADIIGAELFNQPRFKSSESVKTLLDVASESLELKSSILSQYILQNVVRVEEIVDTLLFMANSLERQTDVKRMRNFFKEILKYKGFERSVKFKKDKDKFSKILSFYEQMKQKEFCKNNVQFWLQYAIAHLGVQPVNYTIVEKYFKKTYELAASINYEFMYKIDNHYCRFLIERELDDGSPLTCIESFKKANEMLTDPLTVNNNYHYTFKVSKKYKEFYDKFYADMSVADQECFIKGCNKMLEICRKKRNSNDNTLSNFIKECQSSLEYILRSSAEV